MLGYLHYNYNSNRVKGEGGGEGKKERKRERMTENFFFPKQFVVQRHSLFQGNLLLAIRPHYQTFPRHIPPPLDNVHQITTNLITDFMAFLGEVMPPSRDNPPFLLVTG